LPWQQFAWQRLMAQLRKTFYRRKDFADTFYRSRVIVHFVSNVVAMATKVSWPEI